MDVVQILDHGHFDRLHLKRQVLDDFPPRDCVPQTQPKPPDVIAKINTAPQRILLVMEAFFNTA